MDLSKDNNSYYQKIMFLLFHKRKAKTNADNFFEITADPTVSLELIENSKTEVATSNEKESSLLKTLLFFSIIDDDAMVRTLLVRILKLMEIDFTDIDIEEFEDGIQFLKSRRLEQSGEHFLILDGVMPAMDGIEILQKVKKYKNEENISVLMLSGRRSEFDKEKALKLGADDYLTKPFNIMELQERIQTIIKRMKLNEK